MKIYDPLTRKDPTLRNNGEPDMRFRKNKSFEAKEWMFLRKHGYKLSVGLIAFISVSVLIASIARYYNRPLLDPRGTGEVKELIKTVEAQETPYCFDPITCIRDVGEELGRDNKTITTMIRIAQKESSMNPKAKNPNSTASGLFQITSGTWYSNDCVGDKWDFEDNIRCAYEIQGYRGFQPWEVCNTGVAECY